MVNFTVAIPTFNSEAHLHLILDALIAQTDLDDLTWEVIVADNNSSDNTAKIITQYQAKWPSTSQLRYVFEPTQGAGFARHHTLKVARSELVGFLDDDVLPASDWVACAYRFGTQNPHVGIFSGQIHGNFSATPPEGFERIQGFLAIREHGPKAFRFNPTQLSMPTGAAFVTRRKAWLDNVSDRPIFAGRIGSSMVGGEDLEPMLLIHAAGWETWYTPTMHAYHQIPDWRLEKAYLSHLIYTAALCTCQLRILTQPTLLKKAAIIPRLWLGNLKRLFQHLVTHRYRVATQTVPACELAFLLGNLTSPLYFSKTSALRLFNRLSPTPAPSPAQTPAQPSPSITSATRRS